MPRVVIVLLMLCLSGNLRAQSAQRSVLRVFTKETDRLYNLRYRPGAFADDKLSKAPKQMERLVQRHAAALLQLRDTGDNGFSLAHSPDRRFALFSWDTRLGGTMIRYAAIAIFRDADSAVHTLRIRETNDLMSDPLMDYDTVFQLATDKGPLYVAQGFGKGSTTVAWEEIRTFRLLGSRLVPAKVFPGNKYRLFVAFDAYVFGENERMPGIGIREGGRLLRYPESNDNGGFSGHYTRYRFRNGRYRKVKK